MVLVVVDGCGMDYDDYDVLTIFWLLRVDIRLL